MKLRLLMLLPCPAGNLSLSPENSSAAARVARDSTQRQVPAGCRISICLFAGVVFGTTLLAGCSSEPDSQSSKETQARAVDTLTEAETCRRKLSAAIARLAPERVALSSKPERSVNGLNAWVAGCVSDADSSIVMDDAALALLGGNARVTAKRYTAADGFYVRDCLLLRDLSDAIIGRIPNKDVAQDADEVRAVALFEWVVRNVSLISDDQNTVPLSLFDSLMLGRGTVDHRVWLFAELLRQQQVDAVLLSAGDAGSATAEAAADSPAEKADSITADGNTADRESVQPRSVLDSASQIVAVMHEGGGWLFDCERGVPVPDTADLDVLNLRPAGMRALADHPRWQKPEVQLIAQASTFAPRMLILQDNLAAEDACALYEELNGSVSDIRPVVVRVAESSGQQWAAEEIVVWPFPEQQAVASGALSQDQQQRLDSMTRFFDAPFERDAVNLSNPELSTTVPEELSDQERKALAEQRLKAEFDRMMNPDVNPGVSENEKRFGRPSRKFLMARIDQIRGDISTSVIQQLQQVRISSMEKGVLVEVPTEYQRAASLPAVIALPMPKLILEVNESSTGNSMYWTALCQLERGEPGSAITTFENYRRQYPDGDWKYPSMLNQAMAYLLQDRVSEARSILVQSNQADNPDKLQIAFLLDAIPE